jgi:hypothetical protein
MGLRENDSDAWSPIQQWLLQLRRRGLSVLIVHHASKTGGQRGSADKFTQSAPPLRAERNSGQFDVRWQTRDLKPRSQSRHLTKPSNGVI